MSRAAGAFILFTSIGSISCVNHQLEPTSEGASALVTANPAAVHCLDKGYELAEAEFDDSPGLMCVNVESGKKCPVWKYYRNECALSG